MPSLPDTPEDAALNMASKVEREGTTIFPVMISSKGYSLTPNDVEYLKDLSSDNTFADVSDFFALYTLQLAREVGVTNCLWLVTERTQLHLMACNGG